MPLINFECPNGHTESKIFRAGKIPDVVLCSVCGQPNKRVLGAPASTRKITVDNNQSRAVELHPDIVEIRKDWSKPRD